MIDDLTALRLSPEQAADAKASQPRRRKTRVAGDFYLCPVQWANRAAIAVTSAKGLLVALRLYRRSRMCKSEDTIVASNVVLATGSCTREIKRRVLSRLERAGLIEIVEHKKGRAPRVRIVE
jgi:hypothetical protein